MRIEIKLITKLSKLNISLDFFKTFFFFFFWEEIFLKLVEGKCATWFLIINVCCVLHYILSVFLWSYCWVLGNYTEKAQNFEIVSIKNLFTWASATLSGHQNNKNRWKDRDQSDKNVKVKQNFKILGGKIKNTPMLRI